MVELTVALSRLVSDTYDRLCDCLPERPCWEADTAFIADRRKGPSLEACRTQLGASDAMIDIPELEDIIEARMELLGFKNDMG